MPTLDWIGKSRVVNHHLDVPYHVLERVYSFDESGRHDGDNGSGNTIIHGDNLLALKSLLPQYEGRVKCIYIDPPYNTGNENWVYNDNVNDPRIKKWLGDVVGKEGEDLSRHDKWLCMMYPRLKLLQRFLSDDGAIFISIDHNEEANLKLICDEIFGVKNYINSIPWQSRQSLQNDTDFSINHEYIVCYAKNRREVEKRLKGSNADKWYDLPSFVFYPMDVDASKYSNPDNDPRGPWKADPFDAPNVRPNLTYPIVNPLTGAQHLPPSGRCWRISQEKFASASADGRILFGKDGKSSPKLKVFLNEKVDFGSVSNSWFKAEIYGTATSGTKELQDIFDEKKKFETPKPTKLLLELFKLVTRKDSIILDSFAGSGTTAHAVLRLNQLDGGNRKFILVEMGDYADSITAERVKRAICGYPVNKKDVLYNVEITTKNIMHGEELFADAEEIAEKAKVSYDKVEGPKMVDGCLRVVGIEKKKENQKGTGGSFQYYELGAPLFHGETLNEDVGEEELRRYVYFTETREAAVPLSAAEPGYLGTHLDVSYYFHYCRDAVTTLNRDFLHMVKRRSERYVVYADLCTISQEELSRRHIVFKKIPRDISRL